MRSLDLHYTIRVTPLFNNVQGRTLGTVGSLSFSSGRCHKKHHDYKFLSIPCIIPKNVLITCVVFVHGTKSTLVKGKCLTQEKLITVQCSFCPRDKIHTGKREVSNTWVWILSRGVITRHLKTFWTLFMRSLDFHFTIRVTPLFNNVQRRTLGTVIKKRTKFVLFLILKFLE